MKRGVILTIFVLLLVLTLSSLVYFNQKRDSKKIITGDTITGNATSSNFAITISITGAPTLILVNPRNQTYFSNLNLALRFLVWGEDFVWYNLDKGANATITGNTTFSTTVGQHTLYLYANNSEGETTKNATFTVNSTKFVAKYNYYKNNGSSTDFNSSSYEDMQNLSDIILERTGEGKILFNEAINITNCSYFDHKMIDLDSYTNISYNRIEINSTVLPNFNKSATLYLDSLTFTNPRILRDGSVCPSAICVKQSYVGDLLIFNVTQFSVYSAEETPEEEAAPVTGDTATGGGGGGIATAKFEITPDSLHVMMKQGETQTKTITIKNTGTSALNIEIEESKLTDFIKIDQQSFSLASGKTETVTIDFLAREDTIPDLYIGKLIVNGNSVEKEVMTAVEIESKESLFDVEVKIPSKYTKISPGEEILADIKIYNLGTAGSADALVGYTIKDKENNIIITAGDTVAVETQMSFTKTLRIPENTALGRYVLYVDVNYEGKIASSSVFFDVVAPKILEKEKLYIVLITFFLLIVGIIVHYELEIRRKKTEKTIRKVNLIDITKRR
ncbi:MAG: hypothetical protein NTW17_03270 [Candidatus Pacearchaeota archaeon]|nr:hypothetical protein [Candidatus Pacearchaeota archaeon]